MNMPIINGLGPKIELYVVARFLEKKVYRWFFIPEQQRKMPFNKLTLHLAFQALKKKKMTVIKQNQFPILYLGTARAACLQIPKF